MIKERNTFMTPQSDVSTRIKEEGEKNLILHTHFPTLIGVAINPDHQTLENKLTKKCLKLSKKIKSGGQDWISNQTYNTLGTYHLSEDPDFSKINNFVTNQVIQYCKAQSIDLNCLNTNPVGAWLSIYKKNDYQDWHVHNRAMISASYYLRCNDSSAKIYFKNPVTDMVSPDILSHNQLNFEQVWFKPEPGMVVVFRSYLYHCVPQQKNNDTRICLSYNYERKKTCTNPYPNR
jgi:uncharacterized protein (TIGR02466 family)